MTDTLIADAQLFLSTLAANNNRDWWADNKDRYDTMLKAPAEALLDRLAPRLSELADAPVRPKLFRPHRDVRFSKDKTPYHTYLRLLWMIETPGRAQPAFYVGIDAASARAGGGIMAFERGMLDDWRKMIDLDGRRIGGLIDGLTAAGFVPMSPPALKRVPAPFAADHPQAELLKRKGIGMMCDVAEAADLDKGLLGIFTKIERLTSLISSIA